MTKQGEILKNYIRSTGASQEDFALKVGYRQRQGLAYHFKSNTLDNDLIDKLKEAEVYDDFIQYAKKHYANDNDFSAKSLKSNAVKLDNINVMYVPLVHKYARAGYLTGFGDDEYLDELPKIPMIVDKEYKGKYIAFEIKGDSMDNGTIESYVEGDIAFGRAIEKQHWYNKLHINKWDFIIVHKEEGILVKRIIAHNVANATITIHSLNDEFEDQILNLDDILEIYNVVKIEREMKR